MLEEVGYICEMCGITEWMGQPVPVVMDHIDGNHANNSRANLRLVCHNCDAQLPTYKNKNAGNGRASRMVRYHSGLSY
ncbi:HNH endonuclease [Rhizobium rhizogenes]|nr:HNH endonuclease [Rhizobium rhizogenes]